MIGRADHRELFASRPSSARETVRRQHLDVVSTNWDLKVGYSSCGPDDGRSVGYSHGSAFFGPNPLRGDYRCVRIGERSFQPAALRESLFFRDTVSPLVVGFEGFHAQGA